MLKYLLLPSTRYVKFPFGCFVRLLYDTVKDYNLSPNQGAEKCPTDSFISFGAYLE